MFNTKEIKKQVQTIKSHSINEYRETIHLLRLLKKRAKSREDKAFIKHQSLDVIKISFVIVIGALPGGTVAIAFIEMAFRKMNKTILPTTFNDDIHKRIEEIEYAKKS